MSAEDRVPLAFGLFHPTVVLPRRFVDELRPDELRLVLAHELAHHRRGDLWLNGLQNALAAVWWFDPIYWLLSRELRSTREDCCDDLLLAGALSSGQAYCETLLRAARIAVQSKFAETSLACGLGTPPLRRRLVRVMHIGFRPAAGLSLLQWAAVAGLGFLLLPGTTSRAARPVATSSGGSIGATSVPVPDAVQELQSSDPEIRAAAATELGRRRSIEFIPQLVALLSDDSPIVHAPEWRGDWSPVYASWLQPSPGEAAALALASMSQDAAMPLVTALQDPDATTRRNAAWALGELHSPRWPGMPEVPPLVQALSDVDGRVRTAAAWALGETKDRRATQPLISTLHDSDSDARRMAAHALGEIAAPDAVDALREARHDSNADVRFKVVWALQEIRDKVAASPANGP
jgi:hypothetical protein